MVDFSKTKVLCLILIDKLNETFICDFYILNGGYDLWTGFTAKSY